VAVPIKDGCENSRYAGKNFIVDFLLKKKSEEFTKPFGCACILQPFGCTLFIETMKRDIFQAIADPTRRAIIALIALQAMTPNAIAEHFDTTRQAVSKHLRILTECELVRQEQKGREIYYSLEIEKMKEIDKWLDQYRKIWETRFEQLGEVLKVMKKKKSE
jgi:DNA-binding transcriptional ArsR family regulator